MSAEGTKRPLRGAAVVHPSRCGLGRPSHPFRARILHRADNPGPDISRSIRWSQIDAAAANGA